MDVDRGRVRKSKDPVVYALSRPSRCYHCDMRLLPGEIVKLEADSEEREVLCRVCAGLAEFECISSGNAKVTRLVSKYSSTRYVVLRWSDLWKCYQRQGIMVERQAVDKVELETGLRVRQSDSAGQDPADGGGMSPT